MTVSLSAASLMLKDKDGNTGVVRTLSDNDVTKLNTVRSDVAKVVSQTTHLPIEATTSSVGVVTLADTAAITAGTAGRVVDAAQLKAVSDAAAQIDVSDTYVEPTDSEHGLISPAENLLTTPQSGEERAQLLSRFIGEIVTSSVPINDPNVHLANGDIIYGDGVHSEFVAYMATQSSGSNFCTEEEWQTSVSTYGVCGKYVYDSTNNTIRLPQLTGFLEGTLTEAQLGALTEAGLPNITGAANLVDNDSNVYSLRTLDPTGAFYGVSTSGYMFDSNVSSSTTYLRGGFFDASRSNAIYGKSNTVQPQSVKVYYYVVLGTITQIDSSVDISKITNDFAKKSNVDFSNTDMAAHVVETYHNGASWYRLWSDGWCEQGGSVGGLQAWYTITFIKPFKDTNFSFNATAYDVNDDVAVQEVGTYNKRSTAVSVANVYGSAYYAQTIDWRASGYVS